MGISYRPTEAPDIERAKYIHDEKEFTKIVLIGTFAILIFLPFLVLLPLMILSIYHKDRSDFENPYVRKWHYNEMWKLMWVLVVAEVFFFLIFPLLPKNLPVWGFWASLTVPNLAINLVLLSILLPLTVWATISKIRPYFELKYHPYRDLVHSSNYLIVPTHMHGTVILRGLNTGIMVLGAAGSGKTELIKQLVYQLPDDEDYTWVIFDPKGDYLEEFGDREKDVILSMRKNEATYSWNIFREIAPKDPLKMEEEMEEVVEKYFEYVNKDWSKSKNIAEMSGGDLPFASFEEVWNAVKSEVSSVNEIEDPVISISQIMSELFKDLQDSSQDKFWNYAAQQVLEAYIYIMYKESVAAYKEAYYSWEEWEEGRSEERKKWDMEREKIVEELQLATSKEEENRLLEKLKEHEKKIPQKPKFEDFLPTNADLYDLITHNTYKDAYDAFSKYPELKMVSSYVNPKAEKMAASVWAVLGTQFRRIFQGTFGKDSREFKQISMKEYMRNPKGRKLFIEYDVSKGDVLGAIYRVLVDRLIEFGFERGSEDRTKYFIIDEFQNVPKLNLYQNLVNYGRSYNMMSVIGIQNLTQVVEKYGREMTNSIVSGHRFIFAFSLGDEESRKFVESEIGKKTIWFNRPVQVSGLKGGGSMSIGAEYQKIDVQRVDIGNIRFWNSGEVILIARNGILKTRLFTFEQAKPKIDKVKSKIREIRRWEWERKNKSHAKRKPKPAKSTASKPNKPLKNRGEKQKNAQKTAR